MPLPLLALLVAVVALLINSCFVLLAQAVAVRLWCVADLRVKAAYNPHRLMDEKYRYMHWLEKMWEVHKFDIPGRTQREERKKEETLEMFRGLVELSKCGVDPPDFPPWERSLW